MRFFIIGVVLLFVSCNKEVKVDKPENLISKTEMSDILYDMFVISSSKGSSIDILKDNGIQPDEYVLNKYDIDSLQFKASNDYYAHDIETYTEILTTVQNRLEAEKVTLEAQIEKEQKEKTRKSDSIKELKPRGLRNIKSVDSITPDTKKDSIL